MGRADYLRLGDWNAACFACGFKFKASELRRQWQGFYTCRSCWEPRQPQDFVRAQADIQTAPWSQQAQETWVSGDPLITEQSPTLDPDYILTETSYPLTTE